MRNLLLWLGDTTAFLALVATALVIMLMGHAFTVEPGAHAAPAAPRIYSSLYDYQKFIANEGTTP